MAISGAAVGAEIYGLAKELALTSFNNQLAIGREELARERNFYWGEKSADKADLRTRKLYEDLYSPQAQIQQIKDAGLSSSLMYGGGASGVSGHAGAQGVSAGITPNIYGVSAVEAAQVANLNADTNKKVAETQNTQQDTKIKDIEESIKKIEFAELKISADALFEYVKVNGERKSLYEFAGQCTSYENFTSQLRKMGIDTEIVNTEQGQRTLRDIYLAHKKFSNEIATLSEEETSANFEMAITNALQKADYANANAENILQQLRTEIATNELTESQKDAWNDLLNKLESTHPALKDIAVIIGLIVSQFGGKVNANFGKTTQEKHVTTKRTQ